MGLASPGNKVVRCRSFHAPQVLHATCITGILASGPESIRSTHKVPASPATCKSGNRITAVCRLDTVLEPGLLTIDDRRVLDIANGRGVHDVAHDKPLDRLVLRHQHARGLAPHTLHLQRHRRKLLSLKCSLKGPTAARLPSTACASSPVRIPRQPSACGAGPCCCRCCTQMWRLCRRLTWPRAPAGLLRPPDLRFFVMVPPALKPPHATSKEGLSALLLLHMNAGCHRPLARVFGHSRGQKSIPRHLKCRHAGMHAHAYTVSFCCPPILLLQ